MKIRSQLALLVLAVVVPVALLAAATTVRLWTLQRQPTSTATSSGLSALRLALDTRLDATTRLLRGPERLRRARFARAAAAIHRTLRPAAAVQSRVGDHRPARRRRAVRHRAHALRHAADPAARGRRPRTA
jgi:hypothetical protein